MVKKVAGVVVALATILMVAAPATARSHQRSQRVPGVIRLAKQLGCTKYKRDAQPDVAAQATADCRRNGHYVIDRFRNRAHQHKWMKVMAPAAPYDKGRVVAGHLWVVMAPDRRRSKVVLRRLGGHIVTSWPRTSQPVGPVPTPSPTPTPTPSSTPTPTPTATP